MYRPTIVVLAIANLGCSGEVDHAAREPPPALQVVMSSLGPPLQKLNGPPGPSLAVPGAFIDLWVSEVGWPEYAQVSTSRSGSRVVLPVGTTIVRVLRGASGEITRFTALVKREPGFYPPGDLFFAVYDVDGQKARAEDGSPQEGKMEACMSCHRTRSSDGYVFGWPDGEMPLEGPRHR